MNLYNRPVQFYCFSLALLIYAIFSSPTPDSLGWMEIIIGLLLILSIRIEPHTRHLFPWIAIGYGLTIPMILGVINGHHPIDMVRDIIPFIFLFLPIFYGWMSQDYSRDLIKLYAVMGLIFSVRTFVPYQSVLLTPSLWGQGPPADLLYLANSPEVLCSALLCIGYGGKMLMQKGSQKLAGFGLCALATLPMIAMALMMQRAGIGAVILFTVLSFCYLGYARPKWAGIFVMLLAGILIPIWTFLHPVIDVLWQKTELVGFNSRTEEWEAVFNMMSMDWVHLLLGSGWGGLLENPAVGGLNVNFTHSLLSSLLLKTGMLGMVLIVTGCLMPVFRACLSLMSVQKAQGRGDIILFGAVIFPFLISVFLYASYKSLGFGLILLVFSILSIRKLEKNQ